MRRRKRAVRRTMRRQRIFRFVGYEGQVFELTSKPGLPPAVTRVAELRPSDRARIEAEGR